MDDLEEIIKRKFARLSTAQLIARMNRAFKDQNLDDETFELERRLKAQGKEWHWDDAYPKPKVVVEAKR